MFRILRVELESVHENIINRFQVKLIRYTGVATKVSVYFLRERETRDAGRELGRWFDLFNFGVCNLTSQSNFANQIKVKSECSIIN